MHETQRVTDQFQHRKPGAGKAAILAHTGRLLSVKESSLGATLSAFWSPWTSRLATVQFAHLLATGRWSAALLLGGLCPRLTLRAVDTAASC